LTSATATSDAGIKATGWYVVWVDRGDYHAEFRREPSDPSAPSCWRVGSIVPGDVVTAKNEDTGPYAHSGSETPATFSVDAGNPASSLDIGPTTGC